ncbi:glycoside hydrolase family 55 protein [Pyxidicoccus xibeiensis]|uniref:glycoside hydrolase family 55 protein n=1 Tax=Pyxidicoccus xibeiensis TaxID=2906759 RepID=UPI0020A7C123|nr:glycoside hydrolase family 55 protein [Pyxidicoccus xibeiensis]MCP3143232.1 glycoside hydrolase family 55 protein [Pyxidicoccus xibeiensis]
MLYPSTWTPGYRNPGNSAQFLHDFSYAGYRQRQVEPPVRTDRVLTVTAAPYFADNTGASDVTAILQQAIDDAGAVAGGGVVLLPSGTYRVSPPSGKAYALLLNKSNVVLRGQGPTSTFLYNSATNMRGKSVIRVSPQGTTVSWTSGATATVSVTADVPVLATRIPVSSVTGYAVGNWVVVRSDVTAALSEELNMGTVWTGVTGPTFYRRVTEVDSVAKTLTVDIPLRLGLKTRDNARVHKIPAHVSEVGVENLAIGMRENATPGTGDEDYTVAGTGAYEMHDSFAISMNHVVDGWLVNVSSYRPPSNTRDVHLLSNGIDLLYSRNVTVDACELGRPQYKGGGGNGYLFSIRGSDSLIKDSAAYQGRHNFNFRSMYATGNVLFSNRASDGTLVSDFHMHLSAANLLDNLTLYQEKLEAADRSPYGTVSHGVTTTQSVFWNTHGAKYRSGSSAIIRSQQYGEGYVIGVRGSATGVELGNTAKTAPTDFAETASPGEQLVPQSLYVDQLKRRLGSTVEHDGHVLVYQAENLKPTNAGQRSSTNTEASADNGSIRYHNGSAVGDAVSYALYPRTLGTFSVRVRTKKLNTRGQYQLDINGVNQGPVQDEYSSSAVFSEANLGTVTFSDLEPKTFTFTVVGRNAASSGYNVAVDSITLVRQ